MSQMILAPFLPQPIIDTDNTVALWYKKPGDRFKFQEPLLALYTAEGVLEIPTQADGILTIIFKTVGSKVKTYDALGSWITGLPDDKPFTTTRIRATQTELMKGERQFGKVDYQYRKDPAETSANQNAKQASTTLKSHPLLANSQMWAGMAENDSWIANSDTLVEFFEEHPELVNDPELRMQLENAKRLELTHSSTPKPSPFGT